MSKRKKKQEFFRCPHCGAAVRVGAAACRECGSDEETGWSEEAEFEQIDMPEGYAGEDDFDYDEFVRCEFPNSATTSASYSVRNLVMLAVVVLVCLALLMFSLGF